MKTINIKLLLFLSVVLTIAFTSCGGDSDDQPDLDQSEIIGTWRFNYASVTVGGVTTNVNLEQIKEMYQNEGYGNMLFIDEVLTFTDSHIIFNDGSRSAYQLAKDGTLIIDNFNMGDLDLPAGFDMNISMKVSDLSSNTMSLRYDISTFGINISETVYYNRVN